MKNVKKKKVKRFITNRVRKVVNQLYNEIIKNYEKKKK